MERNHIYNNLKSYKSELCRLEFSTNMGLQLGLCHCQGKRRNQLFGFTQDAGETEAKDSICVWVWPLRPAPENPTITHAHSLSILFSVWFGCRSDDAYFSQEKEASIRLGPLLAAPCICTSIYPICSENLLPVTYQNSPWLPIIDTSLAWHAGSCEVCPSRFPQWSLPRVPFRCLLLSPTRTAHHFLTTQNALSRHDQKPKLTSRERKRLLSHNRDSRGWVGCRVDGHIKSVMASGIPPLCSATLSPGFNLRGEAIGCHCSNGDIQTWRHLEEQRTLSFRCFFYSKR